MSDHEGEGLDLERWEVATLPGASIYSYAASDVAYQTFVPGETSFHPPTAPRYMPQRESSDRVIPQNVLGHAPRYPTTHGQHVRSRDQSFKSPAELLCDAGRAPNGELELLSPWSRLRYMALKIRSLPHPLQHVQDIMNKSDTFIRKPEEEDDTLYVWGEPKQVELTIAELSQWEQDVRNTFVNGKTSAAWTKMHALDGRAEHRLDRQSKQNALHQHLREASLPYPFQAALLWPKDMDVDEFESLNEDALNQLRTMYICHIAFPPADIQHIIIEAYQEQDVLKLISRILNLIKETISRRDQLVMVNMVHLPEYEIYRDRVGLQDKDPRTDSYLPTLHGNLASNEQGYAKDRQSIHNSNRRKTRRVLDSSLKRLRLSQQHVRLRVVFGELGFTLFQKPAGGADTYTFDDFSAMVTKGRTKLTLNSLPVRQGDIMDLPDILDTMEAFSNRTETYGAFFDFPARSAYTTLRLNTSFAPNAMGEFDTVEQQWLEIGDKVSKLQVSLLSFDRPDFQITLDAFPLYHDAEFRPDMEKFRTNLSFEAAPTGDGSSPRRRVKYPPAPQVQTMSELTMIKWNFKQTDGVFELRRKDIYDEGPGKKSPFPVETRWHAVYYYPEWDILMGQFSIIKPGEDIKWAKSAATFFPESDKTGSALPQGFKNFMTEVEEIQELLAEAISRLAKGKMTANGVNGGPQSVDGS
ncbi:hypothetical protein LTR99_004348 [Exophiala xenobiotica]|uniref:DUF7905 domain-containing protein n=1 Tax=Vermiconidia calcicola TaxID=1690605 RepID=A0AAV9QAF1_9PEZI|nr:hypothetical protein H2202_009280 [Exophiala xenobiotica]KAK5537917.1 hypothetical protein LTR23_007377 [Chaetothyriales sp. CCFEE 6169]KAK5539629.1 hypothetical protein LTR25_003333 [Vermiconidia calcicola]KAK5210722.1 hypothetical protein LTR41_003333 [Exophiala xenobiotica]KAK5224950.1 hypothetical protein LTR72_004732 [Exophiala xenobiotica]